MRAVGAKGKNAHIQLPIWALRATQRLRTTSGTYTTTAKEKASGNGSITVCAKCSAHFDPVPYFF